MSSTTAETAGGMAGWVTDIMEKLGAPGAGIAVALENLFPPIPSEVVLPLAGFAAGQGRFGLVEAIVWTTIGSVVGAWALYLIGQTFGRDRMIRLWDRLPLVKPEDLVRTEAWFERHGTKAVFFGRMVPLFRSLISVPAGIERMPIGRFLVLTAAGSAIWNSALVGAGYLLGDNWSVVEGYVGIASRVVLATVVVAVATYLIWRLRTRRDSPELDQVG